ncbi:hypothetical protein Q8F55_005747 [Vanrija albida]|uniref:Uncharacterized protein n=1 Tax=Vanrija albida TaxID=181172 RepID=A0ABR3Q3I7_9TREE
MSTIRFLRPMLQTTTSSTQHSPAVSTRLALANPTPTLKPQGWARFKARALSILRREAASAPTTAATPESAPHPEYPLGLLPPESFFEQVAKCEEEYRNVKVFWAVPGFQTPKLWDKAKLYQQRNELVNVLVSLDWHKAEVESTLAALARCQSSRSGSASSIMTDATDAACFPGAYPWSDRDESNYVRELAAHPRAAVMDYLNAHYIALSQLRDDVAGWQSDLLAVIDHL